MPRTISSNSSKGGSSSGRSAGNSYLTQNSFGLYRQASDIIFGSQAESCQHFSDRDIGTNTTLPASLPCQKISKMIRETYNLSHSACSMNDTSDVVLYSLTSATLPSGCRMLNMESNTSEFIAITALYSLNHIFSTLTIIYPLLYLGKAQTSCARWAVRICLMSVISQDQCA
jgi:hypothetical protein